MSVDFDNDTVVVENCSGVSSDSPSVSCSRKSLIPFLTLVSSVRLISVRARDVVARSSPNERADPFWAIHSASGVTMETRSFLRTPKEARTQLPCKRLRCFIQHCERSAQARTTPRSRTLDIIVRNPCDDGDFEFLAGRIGWSSHRLDPKTDRRSIQHVEESTTRHARLAGRQRTSWPITDQPTLRRGRCRSSRPLTPSASMNRPSRNFDSRTFDPVEKIECSDERWLALQFV